MRSETLTIVLCLFSLSLPGQSATNGQYSRLIVMGRTTFIEPAETQGFQFFLEEDPTKCDPVKGTISIEEQFYQLTQTLAHKNLNVEFERPEVDLISPHRKLKYRFVHADPEIVRQVGNDCQRQGIQIQKTFYQYPPFAFPDEDALAAEALQDARRKAETIAHSMGKRLSLVAIDDDTSSLLLEDLDSDLPETRAEDLRILLEYMNANSTRILGGESQQPARRNTYGVVVIYDMH